MNISFQDSAQRTDSAAAATMAATAMPQPERRGPPQNVGYLQAVFAEAVLLFGGYWLLLHRRSAKLRERQKSSAARR